ncbi:uncharacterized protein BXZ73DRAFT_46350, partial [Epithele typhae]|uniref:uncharacterized protein n=1 Tax=Epithele typhae TaxID=378194 RepID=UPI0020083692
CHFCGKIDIGGFWYKCLQCTNCDRCSSCMSSPKAWASHDPSHRFFPIQTNNDLSHYWIVKHDMEKTWQPPYVHLGVTCSGCQTPNIRGARHRCLMCDDYELCRDCASDPEKRMQHNPKHPLFPIKSPLDKSVYDEARRQVNDHAEARMTRLVVNRARTSIEHHDVTCMGCAQTPLLGVRYRCMVCLDYDLCSQCHSDPVFRDNHPLDHAFFPIPDPRFVTAYDDALDRLSRLGH